MCPAPSNIRVVLPRMIVAKLPTLTSPVAGTPGEDNSGRA